MKDQVQFRKSSLIAFLTLVTACGTSAQNSHRKSGYVPTRIGTITAQFENTLLGYQITPVGDQNGDGFADFVTNDTRAQLSVYPGGLAVSQLPFLVIDSAGAFGAIEDINGDSKNELYATCRSNCGWKLNLYYGGTILDSIRDHWFGSDTEFPFRDAVLGQDIDLNSSNELIAQSSGQRHVLFFELNPADSAVDFVLKPPNLFPGLEYDAFGDNIEARDFDGDGLRDIAIVYRPRNNELKAGEVWVYKGGTAFDSLPDYKLIRPGGYVDGTNNFGFLMTCPGDLNDDGFDDLLVNSKHSGLDVLTYVYFGGPAIDSVPDMVISERINHAAPAGDLNDDGQDDLIASYFGPASGVGEVYIFFGGSTFDSIPDVAIYTSDYPEFKILFGQGASGIGDYNGDGVDDFAFSAENVNDLSEIYIYSGWQSGTGVEDEPTTLPSAVLLDQNYPNPFNPSTTIEFFLPNAEIVSIEILNVVGQRVRVLLHKRLPAGLHSVTWDGRDEAGQVAASGVYLYELQAGDVSERRKMMLIK